MNKEVKMISYVISFVIIGVTMGFFLGNFFQISTANIAIINIDSEISPYQSLGSISSDTIISLIKSAENNPNVEAIILSINSPGGSVVSTQEIVNKVKASSKPIIGLIRAVGASGAYWIASACDKIISSPLSITGSIGVTATYLEYSGLFEEYGITYVNLSYPQEKDIGSMYREMTENERNYMMDILNTTYFYVVLDIAENRNMTYDQVIERSGNGTIILGKRAYDDGLVDYLGDLDSAILVAAELGDIAYPETEVFGNTQSITDLLSWFYSGSTINRMNLKV